MTFVNGTYTAKPQDSECSSHSLGGASLSTGIGNTSFGNSKGKTPFIGCRLSSSVSLWNELLLF